MKVFCPEPIQSEPLNPLFFFRFVPEKAVGGLFKENLPKNFFEHEVEYVSSVSEAEVILLPNNLRSTSDEVQTYVSKWVEEGKGKPVYAFSFGDFTDRLVFDERVKVFVNSTYRRSMRKNQIIVPTLTEDLGVGRITLRPKTEKPTVSFCGQAGYKTLRQWVAYVLKNFYFGLKRQPEHKLGVYWRRAMMRACRRSSVVRTNFIVRRSFSGALRTIELDPKIARAQFTGSIIESDFVLAPKGDGNYSNRFLEALSLGRIPVVVDTDIVLPFEDEIDYSSVMVRVPMDRVKDTPGFIREWYDALTEAEWNTRQQLAREVFETYLKQDSFFRHYFESLGGSK